MNKGTLTLPQVGGEGHALVFAPSAKGKSLMPDNTELAIRLAEKAFELIGSGQFRVSANLSVDNADSLRNFGLFQSVLVMVFNEGQATAAEALALRARVERRKGRVEVADALDAAATSLDVTDPAEYAD